MLFFLAFYTEFGGGVSALLLRFIIFLCFSFTLDDLSFTHCIFSSLPYPIGSLLLLGAVPWVRSSDFGVA